jgi:hypothetical protein
MTTEQQAIRANREEWEKDYPAKSYLTPEGPTIGPEDLARLEAEAKNYDFDRYRRKEIIESYEEILQAVGKSETDLRAELAEDNYPDHVVAELVAEVRDETLKAQLKKQIESHEPYPWNASRRDKKAVDKHRDNVQSILSKSPAEFTQLQVDWQAYEDIEAAKEQDRLHAQANEDDAKKNAKKERAERRKEMDEIDVRNGGALEHLSQYDIEKDARTAEILQDYKSRLARNKDKPIKLKADRLTAFHDLKWRLGEVLADSGLTEEEITSRTAESDDSLIDWLDSMADEHDPLKDLEDFKNKQRAHENWDSRRRAAVEVLAPVVLGRLVQRKFLEIAEKAAEIPISGKLVDILLDSRKIGANNGAHMLRRGDRLSESDTNVNKAGIMGQLELAASLSRGNLIKAALHLKEFALAGNDHLFIAWDKMHEAEQRKAVRKKMYGKAAVGAAVSRRIAKKAAKRIKEEARYQSGYLYVTEKEDPNAR